MSILIIGGAFVVALLAIVGLVFLLRSAPEEVVPKVAMPAKAESAVAVPVAALQENMQQRPVTMQRAAPATQKLPLHLEAEVPAIEEEEEFPISNGHWHELSAQLSTLHEQAQEFENRLNVLSDMIRHIEQNGDGSFEEEEAYTPHNANR